METTKAIIGTNTAGYPEIRNFYDLPFQKYVFEKRQNLNKIPSFIYTKLTGQTNAFLWNAFIDFNLNNVELFHFFNAISFGKTPWISTFETRLPRWGEVGSKIEKHALKLLAGNACRRIIALSECTANLQRDYIYNEQTAFAEEIESKLLVLHPAQIKLLSNINDKIISEKVVFTFIGRDFFRKGGKEMLMAFDRLFEEGFRNWELNIISRLELDTYASKATNLDQDFVKSLIGKYPLNIRHHYSMPNHEVLQLLLQSNVSILPSYAETYGYSVLEAQSAGCPVITTNTRAFPEINNNEIGWIIEVPCDSLGISILESASDRKKFSNTIFEQLVIILKNILTDPSITRKKGKLALDRIEQQHSVLENTRILESIYDEITGRTA